MVPLTGSMYVPGTIADSENVIIDVGTGYYLQKDIDGAKDYFKRKVTFVTEQMEKIQAVGMEKSKIREETCRKFAVVLWWFFEFISFILPLQPDPKPSMNTSPGGAIASNCLVEN
ncbi:putative prefoldin subunit 5 isoform X2 [Lycorma delicatula]